MELSEFVCRLFVGEVEKMEPDTENDLQEENVTNEGPMEIDTNDDEQQQLKQFLQLKQHQQPQQATDVVGYNSLYGFCVRC